MINLPVRPIVVLFMNTTGSGTNIVMCNNIIIEWCPVFAEVTFCTTESATWPRTGNNQCKCGQEYQKYHVATEVGNQPRNANSLPLVAQ